MSFNEGFGLLLLSLTALFALLSGGETLKAYGAAAAISVIIISIIAVLVALSAY